ncbi:L,D-transpeptidase family protein [Streptomyces sp. NBC_00893]|uniref:L,D-transpeptidase family protein n=1 Tax=Streptomyces sp. NBC_00893 TaxID=2975862 RepID=UPI0022519268|nr:L,D-transpeptidase [Streptomyces sp. NBC_00893]MCX4851486.1 L,D-transpeptidase [Streptomyces sp. NBC_00893]
MSATSPLRVRAAAIGLTAMALMTVAAVTAPSGRAAAPAGGRPAATDAVVTTLKFVRNSADPQNSRLLVVRNNKTQAAFRAGSGLGRNHAKGRDECASAKGWLPAGTYTVGARQTRYNGNLIKGYAIPLSNKTCKNGRTTRTELFIHSEMTRAGGQGSTESRRWDGVGDYKSAGCIKLAPEDIKKLFRNLGRGAAPKRLVVV